MKKHFTPWFAIERKAAFSFIVALLLCAVRVQAQPLVIHNHPQKATYASPAEWPTPWSSQGHWMNADGHMSHLHVDPLVPLYAEIDGTMTFSITVGLFDTVGSIMMDRSQVLTGWHDGALKGTLNLPPLQGVRGQFVSVTGTVTVTPPIPHGVYNLSVDITASTDDGKFQTVRARRPMYSTLDVSQPELTYNNWLSTECNFGSHVNGEDYGQQTVEFDYFASDPSQPFIPVPIAPMAHVWPMYMSSFGYTQSSFNGAPGAARFVLDPNYHAGDPGTTLESVTQFPDSQGNVDILHVPMIFDHPGTHKYAVIRDLPTPNVGEHVMCLLVGTLTGAADISPVPQPFPVLVIGPPPPVTCTLPDVMTNGQCVTPPPPPPPPAVTVVKIQMCAIETLSDGSVKNKCIDVP